MLVNETKKDAENRVAEYKKFLHSLINSVDSCVLRGSATATIEKLKTAKERETDEEMKRFIDIVIELLNDSNGKAVLSARDEATAIVNNWTRLRRLVAQKGFSISRLSRETGIARDTISRHLIDGNFAYTQMLKIQKALNIPDIELQYYFFDEIGARMTA